MKKLILCASALLILFGCQSYSSLWDVVNNHEKRLSKLERQCSELNNNIISMGIILDALQMNDYLTGVTPLVEDGKEIGYVLTFAKSGEITIYHGTDRADGAPGQDGADGAPGQDGEDGAPGQDGDAGQNGEDGSVPVIGVRKDADGRYYWTLNGEWLLDDEGNKLPTTGAGGQNGADGAPGQDGAPGADGVTPMLKIEDGYWYVSYDDGKTWDQLGKAVGDDGQDGDAGDNGDSFFKDVTQDETCVYLTLKDGTVIKVPKMVPLSIEFDEADLVVMPPNSTREIAYRVKSQLPDVVVEAISSADIYVKVVPDSDDPLSGVLVITTGYNVDEYSKVVVFVSNGEKVVMKVLKFEEESIEVIEDTDKIAPAEGGALQLEFLSNMEYEVIIADDARSWISIVPDTRAMEKQTITLMIEENNGFPRETIVTISNMDGTLELEYYIYQGSTDPYYYTSTDYSADGRVTTLHKATKGNGINVILMGDAYSDRLIADGTYAADMEAMMDAFFSEEPYKSFKDHFNVYSIDVVSANEVYDEYRSTALDGYFGEGTEVGGNDDMCFAYGLCAISEDEMDEALIIVAMNSEAYAGTCYMWGNEFGDYGSGPAVAYFPVGSEPQQLAQLVHHEAGGHGFAKLHDEYAYMESGEISQEEIDYYRQLEPLGWWKNVDFTDDWSEVKWSHFLNDIRYADQGLGVFEGACTYWSGAYRPTYNSIMRYNSGGFNAPSREAIYYRIHKLAYGDSWEYDYEDFVEYDAVNRTEAAVAARNYLDTYVERTFEPTAPPVIVRKSWRDAE